MILEYMRNFFKVSGTAFPFELVLAELLLLATQKKQRHFLLRFLLTYGLYGILFLLIPPSPVPVSDVIRFNSPACIWYRAGYCGAALIASFLCGMICYWETPWVILFCCLAGYCIQHISYFLYALLCFQLLPDSAGSQYLIMGAVYGLFLFLFLRMKKKNLEIYVENHETILFAVAVLTVNIILSVWQNAEPRGSITRWVESVYSVVSCILILFIQFKTSTLHKEEHRAELIRQMWHKDAAHYQISKETIDSMNRKYHDMKYLLSKATASASSEQLEQLTRLVSTYDSVVHTGCEALDTVLTEKLIFCSGNGIVLTCMVDGSGLNHMQEEDVYCLFGNALDNAIEAVASLPMEQRTILLVSKQIGNLLSLHMENYFDAQLEIRDNLPLTTKVNPEEHGFGTRSMTMLVKKYGGAISFRVDGTDSGKTFHLNILLPTAFPAS